jgi:hypothetical protein
MEVHEIHGLSNSTDLDSKGYLVFTKTRCCNERFYEWYMTTIVVPFVKKMRELFPDECVNLDGSPMRAFVYCDGEEKQIKVFQTEAMINLLIEVMIDLGKSPASCSAITQSSDVSPLFKILKKALLIVLEKIWQNSSINRKLINIFSNKRNFSDENI